MESKQHETDRDRAVRELSGALEQIGSMLTASPLKHIAETGRGGLHIADMHIRDDGRDYNIEADFVDDLVRGAFHALQAMKAEGELLNKWASISKGLGLSKRSGEIADYDDELASIVAETATATLAWREEQWLAAQERETPAVGSASNYSQSLGALPSEDAAPAPVGTIKPLGTPLGAIEAVISPPSHCRRRPQALSCRWPMCECSPN